MAKSVSLAVNAVEIVNRVATKHKLNLPAKVVMFHYDEGADVLYVHFEYPARAADSDVLGRNGEVILGLDAKEKVVSITVLNASSYRSK